MWNGELYMQIAIGKGEGQEVMAEFAVEHMAMEPHIHGRVQYLACLCEGSWGLIAWLHGFHW